jgi:hypothetical protein
MEAEVCQDLLRKAFDALDEHRLTLPVGADHVGMKGHRQLGDGVEAGEGAVAGKHLLEGDAGVAGAEEVY